LLTEFELNFINSLRNSVEEKITDYETSMIVSSVMYITNVRESASLRALPDENSSLLKNIPFENAVGFVRNSENGYSRVEHNGMYGYVKTQYLRDTKPATNVTQVLYVTNVESGLNLRTSPYENSKVITTISLDSAVGYIEDLGEFYRVEYQGLYGFVKAQYLTKNAPQKTVVDILYVGKVENEVNLRKSPNSNSGVITTIPLGNAVGFIANANWEFAKVEYNGKYGFVNRAYLVPYRTVVKNAAQAKSRAVTTIGRYSGTRQECWGPYNDDGMPYYWVDFYGTNNDFLYSVKVWADGDVTW
ncbi:MAG: SH3 domain-containing protein, partial [Oscillospiraceae bacterium]